MKKTILLIAASGLLAACGGTPRVTPGLPFCDNLNIPPNCENSAGTGPSNPEINFNKNGESVAPKNVCTSPNVKLQFKITPASQIENPPGGVMIIPKDPENVWLSGTNGSDNQKIEIDVPPDLPIGTTYDYTIVYLKNGVLKCIDPRVHVM